MQSKTTFSSQGAGNPGGANTGLGSEAQTKLVPEIDAKLGVSYTLPFNGGSSLSIQGGYMLAAYINAINQVVPTSLVAGAFNQGITAIETDGQNQSDLDLNGPYLSLAWKF